MKIFIQILRITVGGLFIFSGLVKANDPLGLSYKMEEFFEIWHTLGLIPYATSLSVAMNIFEIGSGVALLIGWQNKWNLRLLLVLILFFTALTGYTYYTGFPKTCGCFGDCLPIPASVSFYKDVALLLGILILIRNRQGIRPFLTARTGGILTVFAAILALGMEFYVLEHLPLVDCLPYHIGQNIPEARKQPPPPPGSTVMFVYEKEGKEVVFPADQFPDDFSADKYRFIRRYETGEIPQAKIQGLVFFGRDGMDTTEAVLNSERVFLIFSENFSDGITAEGKGWDNLLSISEDKHIPMVLVTNDPGAWERGSHRNYPFVKWVSCDRTPIRTAARVNPTIYALERGIVRGKWALNDFPSLEDPITGNIPRSN